MGPAERALADRAFEELRADGLIRATYADLVDPAAWVQITDPGRDALARKCLDSLELALSRFNDTLAEHRAGAWSAVLSNQPDYLRQDAHSARELIDQTLRLGAPDDGVRAAPWFAPDKGRSSALTRRHRLRHFMAAHARPSGSQLKAAEKACEFVEAAPTPA